MKGWIAILIAYLVGSFFPITRITGMFSGLTSKKAASSGATPTS